MYFKGEKYKKMRQLIREKMLKQGRNSFALRWALWWGGFMILFMNGTGVLVMHQRLKISDIVISILIFPLGGYFVGLMTWPSFVRRSNESTDEPQSIIEK
jgi:hypothetical protein